MSSDATAPNQFNLDLFSNTALSPTDLAPVGLLRVPMKEPPVAQDESGSNDLTNTPAPAARPALGFRLAGDRGLAHGGKHRALDNIAAIALAAEIEKEGRAATCQLHWTLVLSEPSCQRRGGRWAGSIPERNVRPRRVTSR